MWKAYCEQHGYIYALWAENSPGIKEMLSPNNFFLFSFLLREGKLKEASDLLRYVVLLEHGGFYVDHDVFPPTVGETSFEMEKVFPCRGLVMLINPLCKRTGSFTALHVSTRTLFSAKGHPIMRKAVDTIPANFWAYRASHTDMERTYISGNAFFSSIVAGPSVLIHPEHLKTHNMTSDPN